MLKQDKTYRIIKNKAIKEFDLIEDIHGYSDLISIIKEKLNFRYTIEELENERIKWELMEIPDSDYKYWSKFVFSTFLAFASLIVNLFHDSLDKIGFAFNLLIMFGIIVAGIIVSCLVFKICDNINYYEKKYITIKLQCLNEVIENKKHLKI